MIESLQSARLVERNIIGEMKNQFFIGMLLYSNKNIPIPSRNEYKIQLISKVENVLKRMRWKALQFLGKLEENNKETYGFKSRICPQSVDELSKFEDDLMLMIKNIDFRNVYSKFQEKLKYDITKIRSSKKVIVPADKTRNLYKMEKEDYNKFSSENITKTYKKSNRNKVNKLNLDAKKIADKSLISDRIDQLQKNEAYITVKDHKENF